MEPGKQITFEYEVQPAMLGGFVVKLGQKVADARGRRSARPTGAAGAKKRPHSRRRRLSAELQNVRETSGKLGEAQGSSDPFELFRKMLHFGKIPKKFG